MNFSDHDSPECEAIGKLAAERAERSAMPEPADLLNDRAESIQMQDGVWLVNRSDDGEWRVNRGRSDREEWLTTDGKWERRNNADVGQEDRCLFDGFAAALAAYDRTRKTNNAE